MIKPEHINDNDDIYRRIPPEWYVREEDRISTAAFRHKIFSVDWSKYRTPTESLENNIHFHLAAIEAKIPREKNCEVKHEPSKHNKAHSVVYGARPPSIARHIANNCRIIIRPSV